MKRSIIIFVAMVAAAASYAQQVTVPQGADLVDDFGDGSLSLFFDFSGGYDENLIVNGGGGLQYFGENFALSAEAYLRKDDVYSGTSANTSSGGVGGLYFWMESGGVAYRVGNLSLRAGRLPHYDYVDSPYSLFVNGDGLTTNLMEITYDDGRFLYSSRWMELNHNSDAETTVFSDYIGGPGPDIDIDNTGFPDRGANLHTFAVRFGDMSFGIQDAIVYVGRSFDFEYFISPIPAYIIQDALRQGGRPWTTDSEENNIVGIFWTWDRPDGWKINAQWLLDDGNLHWLAPEAFPTNQPNKIAWTAGASKATPYGRFSFYHAGATKYTFESSYGIPGMEYGYAYFPDVVFTTKSDDEVPIPFETMMLGYKHGENNLAFLGVWNGDLAGFGLGASLEFTVSGSKSPANSWHEYNYNPDNGTELLNEDRLEWKLLAALGATRKIWRFDLYAGLALGYVFNELELVASGETPDADYTIAPYDELQIWRPSTSNRFLFAATLGGRYRLSIR